MSEPHDVPVRPLETQASTRRSRIAIGVVVATFVAIVAIGLAGPQVAPTPSDAPALVPPASKAPATAPASPSIREARLSCLPAPTPFDPATFDLTGVWTGVDGGVYYLSQMGSSVWWNGISDWAGDAGGMGVEWTNVGHGTIDDLRIDGRVGGRAARHRTSARARWPSRSRTTARATSRS